MSSAPRLVQWIRRSHRCAGHATLVQRATTSPGGRQTSLWHEGQQSGITHGGAPAGRIPGTGPTTSGMTSPALRTMIVSPTRTSLRWTSSSLCSVALAMVDPATSTGSNSASGVSAPVRPTCTRISRRIVVFSSGGNLNAIAHRGALDV